MKGKTYNKSSRRESEFTVGQVLDMMEPVKGEWRRVYRCGDCGELFGRRFIPGGLGRGLTINVCLCQLAAHRPMEMVAEAKP